MLVGELQAFRVIMHFLVYLLLSCFCATSYAVPQVKVNDTTVIGIEFDVLDVKQQFFGGSYAPILRQWSDS